jgi:DNA-binding response OmpR family regulator
MIPRARSTHDRPAGDDQVVAMRVLVADDNVDAAKALQCVLKLDGHQAAVAHDGPGALAAAAANPPGLVLVDIGLPGMDGYQGRRGCGRPGTIEPR